MADPLGRWAAQHAPDVLARAEAEAVKVLRDALVRAAIAERAQSSEPAPVPPKPAARPTSGASGVWAYGVLAADADLPRSLTGVDPGHPVEALSAGGLVALVSRVPLDEFGAEPLRENLNDLAWLERVARAHESVLDQAVQAGTCVPLRLCTIYESDESLRAMLEREAESFADALGHLAGREEWSVKLLVDADALSHEARAQTEDIAGLEQGTEEQSEGGAYMLRRRVERRVRERAAQLATEVAESVHARLDAHAVDAVTRPAQNPELSGHDGEMLLNGAYLVEADRVDGLHALVAELERDYGGLGARLELTGPWPPYNFVPGGTGTAP